MGLSLSEIPDLRINPHPGRKREWGLNRVRVESDAPSDDQSDLLMSVEKFKRQNGYWPTACQVLWIAEKLGWKRTGHVTRN